MNLIYRSTRFNHKHESYSSVMITQNNEPKYSSRAECLLYHSPKECDKELLLIDKNKDEKSNNRSYDKLNQPQKLKRFIKFYDFS